MNKSEIEQWLEKYEITNYTIHPNLVVDVDGNVDISSKKLESLPFQFGKVNGFFYCSDNEGLTSLRHCPTTVTNTFSCSSNPQLESLQGCPTTISGSFFCSSNPKLKSLQYFPKTIGRNFYCSDTAFEVTRENEGSWIRAIKTHKDVYDLIKEKATPHMTTAYELKWEE